MITLNEEKINLTDQEILEKLGLEEKLRLKELETKQSEKPAKKKK